jgi:hypothetical protein
MIGGKVVADRARVLHDRGVAIMDANIRTAMEVCMAVPGNYISSVAVPLPDDDAIRSVVGEGYDPSTALNVMKMMAGTEDLYPALMGMVQAVFGAEGIDAKHREMITLRAAAVLNAPYECRPTRRWPPTPA